MLEGVVIVSVPLFGFGDVLCVPGMSATMPMRNLTQTELGVHLPFIRLAGPSAHLRRLAMRTAHLPSRLQSPIAAPAHTRSLT
jgi:hypothetical protein